MERDRHAATLVAHPPQPYKGEAAYFRLASAGDRGRDVLWTYEDPYDAVAAIKGHVAFYADRVDAIEEHAS